jgi:glycosyltransferase involved in cell wall biosynthesis
VVQDNSLEILYMWQAFLSGTADHQVKNLSRFHGLDIKHVNLHITSNLNGGKPAGPGFGRNRAVRASHGEYICFLDADDVMLPSRIFSQIQAARNLSYNTIIGSAFCRIPEDATPRYTTWLNSLSASELYTHRFKEVTLLQPTWLMSRRWFDEMGQQNEEGLGVPEDTLFFYAHLARGG